MASTGGGRSRRGSECEPPFLIPRENGSVEEEEEVHGREELEWERVGMSCKYLYWAWFYRETYLSTFNTGGWESVCHAPCSV